MIQQITPEDDLNCPLRAAADERIGRLQHERDDLLITPPPPVIQEQPAAQGGRQVEPRPGAAMGGLSQAGGITEGTDQ